VYIYFFAFLSLPLYALSIQQTTELFLLLLMVYINKHLVENTCHESTKANIKQ
jgi:hypothetical protein